MTAEQRKPARVVVVGGDFAGVACARELAKHPERVEVTPASPAARPMAPRRPTSWTAG